MYKKLVTSSLQMAILSQSKIVKIKIYGIITNKDRFSYE